MACKRSVALLFLSLAPFAPPLPHTGAAQESAPAARIDVYAGPDDASAPIATLAADERLIPIAESQGTDALTWYLIKTKNGVVGWIKQSDHAEAKKVASFFRALRRDTPVVAASSAPARPTGPVTVPIQMAGRSVIVPVTLNGTLSAALLLDTGASMTMISHRVANSLSLLTSRSGVLAGIGGTIRAKIARIDSVKVGAAEVTDLSVSIHDLSRNPTIDGLLGMDFLGRFQVSVDPAKQLLVLVPR